MESALEQVVIEALDALEAGDESEAIIARYPGHESELRPILSMASSLSSVRLAHSLEAQAASRQRMLAAAVTSVAAANRGSAVLVALRRLSLAMAALLIVLALLGTGMFFASAETVPGDRLYDAKRLIEESRLSLSRDSAARETLQQRYEEERIREIETLLRTERLEEVTFSGIIQAIDGDFWLVAGLDVMLVDATSIDGAGSPAVGQLVQIRGVTINGRVRAEVVTIRSIGSLPLPTPEPSPAILLTVEPWPTETTGPSPTPNATVTPIASPEEAPTGALPLSTPTPSATPTQEPVENGNSNDDDNQNQANGNSNENDDAANGNHNEGNQNEDNGNEDNGNEDNENEDNDNRAGNDNEGNGNSGNDNDDEEENENNDNENRNGG